MTPLAPGTRVSRDSDTGRAVVSWNGRARSLLAGLAIVAHLGLSDVVYWLMLRLL